MRPPLPERCSSPPVNRSASAGAVRRRAGTGVGGSTRGGHSSTQSDQHGGAGRGRGRLHIRVPHEADAAAVAAAPSTVSSVRSQCSAALAEGSSIASESGAPGLHSTNSAGTLGGEESFCGDVAPAEGEDLQSLRLMAITQQQRINFLESMHQRALHELRTVREELKHEQAKVHREADKALRLEELVCEMRAQGYDGSRGGPAESFDKGGAVALACSANC